MTLDFNDAAPQRDFTAIPDGIYSVTINVKPGAAGPDGTLTRSADGTCEMLVLDAIVDEGEHSKAHIFDRLVIRGTTDKQQQAVEISRSKIRGLLESARGIRPDDKSPEAAKARSISSFADLDGLRCLVEVTTEPERTDVKTRRVYPPRNDIKRFITPDRTDWHPLTQYPKDAPLDGGNTGAAVALAVAPNSPAQAGNTVRPQWAK